MVRRIYKHKRPIISLKKPKIKEAFHKQSGNIPLNLAQSDRITFSVLRDEKKNLRIVENVSYEISINDRWEWVVRYDDHNGKGPLHRHVRISLKDNSDVKSVIDSSEYKNKNHMLTWACDDIKRNYLTFRKDLLRNSGLDLY